MSQITEPVKETHEGKQRNNLLLLLYFFVVLIIAMIIAFGDMWPITFFQELMADDKDMYPVKTVFMMNFLSIGLALFPVYWIVKVMIGKKNTAEALSVSEESGTGKKEFSFTYSAAVSTVAIDNLHIQIKMGFVKKLFLTSKLRHYYLLSKNSFQTLHISYEDETGKVKKFPLNADPGDSQMAALVAELQNRFPDKSLNHLPQAEALKTMKVMSPALIVSIILIVIFAALGLVVYFAMT